MLDFLNDFNLVVLSGRTISDKHGELTFIGGNGQSAIDYCCISLKLLPIIEDFHVDNQIFSEHMPIVTIITTEIYSTFDKILPEHAKINWKAQNLHTYQYKMNTLLNSVACHSNNPEEELNLLLNIIKTSSNCLNKRTKTAIINKWFD